MKKLIYSLASLLALCACSQESDTLPEGQRGEEIVLNGSIGEINTETTRAPIESTHAVALDLAMARIDQTAASTWTDWATAPTLQAQRAAVNGSATITFKSGYEQYYTTNQTNNGIRLCAWYPNIAASAGIVTFPVDGKTDVMVADPVEGKATDKFSTSNKMLVLKHALIRLTVKLYGDADAATNWGNITEIKVLDVYSQVGKTIGSSGLGTNGGTSVNLFVKKSNEGDLTGANFSLNGCTSQATASTVGYLLTTCSRSMGAGTFEFQVVTTKGGTRLLTVRPPSGLFTVGNHYIVYLNFKSTTIAPSATISAWSSGGDVAGTFPNP